MRSTTKEENMDRYSISRRFRLIDSKPPKGNIPLVWNSNTHEWESTSLTIGEHMDSVPITEEEARCFMEDGSISEDAQKRLDMEPYDP